MSLFSASFEKKLERLHDIVATTQDELKRLRNLYTNFPDVQVHQDRWRQERYFSAAVNSIATDVDIQISCGAVMARPLTVCAGFNIFSDPPQFHIANESDQYYGYDFYPNWEEKLKEKNISIVVIEKIRVFQEKHKPDPCDNEDDDYIEKNISKGNE